MTRFCDGLSQNLNQNTVNTGLSSVFTKIHTIFEGTSEIQQLVIARAISGLRIE